MFFFLGGVYLETSFRQEELPKDIALGQWGLHSPSRVMAPGTPKDMGHPKMASWTHTSPISLGILMGMVWELDWEKGSPILGCVPKKNPTKFCHDIFQSSKNLVEALQIHDALLGAGAHHIFVELEAELRKKNTAQLKSLQGSFFMIYVT